MVITEHSIEHLNLLSAPEILLHSANSIRGQENVARNKEAKRWGERAGIVLCGDARVDLSAALNRVEIITFSSIAGAYPMEPLEYALDHSGVGPLFILEHHDGTNGIPLTGCGGLAEKHKFATGEFEIVEEDDLDKYVKEDIKHDDVFGQAMVQAMQIAQLTNKPILAGTVDHVSLRVHPFAIIEENGKKVTSSVRLDKWFDTDFIYQKGALPVLSLDQIPSEFRRILGRNEGLVCDYSSLPGFRESQKVQNPYALVISTSFIPAALRFPDVFGLPNRVFELTLPFKKANKQILIEADQARKVIAQSKYPISHSAKAKPGEDFSNMHLVMIDTPSLDLSRQIGQELVNEEWMQQWMAKRPENQVWVSQIRSGITQRIEVIK